MALQSTHREQTKLIVNGKKKPVELIYMPNDRIYVKFGFDRPLMAEVKMMAGHKWHGYDDPPVKLWSIAACDRNIFQLLFLEGKNPYAPWDKEPVPIESDRKLFDHQKDMIGRALTCPAIIWGCEMGTGKTLAAIEVAERALDEEDHLWYVGPKSGVKAVTREFDKWESRHPPARFMTYEALVKVIKTIDACPKIPRMVIFDESSKIKTPTANRSQAAKELADLVREKYGDKGIIILMSGTPAPRVPTDWWHQCEVACPGFLREGDHHKFKRNLCLIEMRESSDGAEYPHLVTWLDDADKCATCGQLLEDGDHGTTGKQHKFENSVNEVARLYKRMEGLVVVHFKKDCIDLPDKRYEVIRIKPTSAIIRTANLIKHSSSNTLSALTLLRELSDGFQYGEEEIGRRTCPECFGEKQVTIKLPPEDYDTLAPNIEEVEWVDTVVDCPCCGSKGDIPQYKRTTDSVACPKDDVLIDQLDLHDDVGRFIVWGGFQGTIDRILTLVHTQGWATLRIDGRGYHGENYDGQKINADRLLDAMDATHPKFREMLEEFPKVCMVGHPQAGGMALNLTASPTEFFYSNTFQGEARMQAEDRFHRPGADDNKGCTIIDVIHLPTDELILKNLQAKRRLQHMTMGELAAALETDDGSTRYS